MSASEKKKLRTEEGTSKETGGSNYGLMTILYIFTAVSFFGLLISVLLGDYPHYSLPLIVIFSLGFFVSSLAIIAAFLRREISGVSVEALGLPTGSVRALIALCLIVIFAIMVVFLYGNLKPVEQVVVSNSTNLLPNGTITGWLNSTNIYVEPSQAQRDFSLQTLTTISTLVVAISSFYFGAKVAKTPPEAVQGKAEEKKLTISYKGEPKVEKGKEFEITIDTKPENQATICKVIGDDETTLSQTGNQFKYKPSEKAAESVELKFAPIKHTDDDWQLLKVTVTEPTPAQKEKKEDKEDEKKKDKENKDKKKK